MAVVYNTTHLQYHVLLTPHDIFRRLSQNSEQVRVTYIRSLSLRISRFGAEAPGVPIQATNPESVNGCQRSSMTTALFRRRFCR